MSYEVVDPSADLKSLVLPANLADQISEVVEDFDFQDALTGHGLTVRKKLLFHGPPGCGKTSIAHGLAKVLKMKICRTPSAAIVASHVGESERNMDAIFKYGQNNRVLVLVDEFDSVGSARVRAHASADLSANRLVNTILTSMETRPPLGLFVACTNLLENLDEAVVRRFDAVLEVPSATRSALKQIAEGIIQGRFGICINEILEEAATPAAVARVATERLRRAVINAEKAKRNADLQMSFDQLEELKLKLNKKTKKSQNMEVQGA